jgi:hypothetical protein
MARLVSRLDFDNFSLSYTLSFIMYSTSTRYNSWFASNDDYDTACTDLEEDSYQTTRFGSDYQSHYSNNTFTSSGHSHTPTVDFQVPLHSDNHLHSCSSHSIPSFISLNSPSLSRQSSTDSGSSNQSSIPASVADSDVDIDIGTQFKLNTPDSLYLLFKARQLQVSDQFGDRWKMLCPECGDWCQMSVHIGLPLWAPGQFKSLANHRGSKKCAATASKKQKHDTQGFSAMTKPRNQSDQHRCIHFGWI